MKKILNIVLAVKFIALSIMANAQEPNAGFTCKTWPIDSLFQWVQLGYIELIDTKLGNRTIAQNYVYTTASNQKIALTESSNAIVKVIREEIKQGDIADFLKVNFINFVIKTYPAQNTFLLNGKYAEEYKEALRLEGRKVAEVDLSKYSSDPGLKIYKNQWSLKFVTINQRGVIRKWSLNGALDEFNIKTISFEELASDIPMPLLF
jgi:hypothetical protein